MAGADAPGPMGSFSLRKNAPLRCWARRLWSFTGPAPVFCIASTGQSRNAQDRAACAHAAAPWSRAAACAGTQKAAVPKGPDASTWARAAKKAAAALRRAAHKSSHKPAPRCICPRVKTIFGRPGLLCRRRWAGVAAFPRSFTVSPPASRAQAENRPLSFKLNRRPAQRPSNPGPQDGILQVWPARRTGCGPFARKAAPAGVLFMPAEGAQPVF